MKVQVKESDLISLIENIIKEQDKGDAGKLKKYYVQKGEVGNTRDVFYVRYANKWIYWNSKSKKWVPSTSQTELDMKFLNADGSLKPAPEKTGMGKLKNFHVDMNQIKDGTPSDDTVYVFSDQTERWFYKDKGKWKESSQQDWLNKNFAGQQYGDLDADEEGTGDTDDTGSGNEEEFVNKTANYKSTTYSIEDVKSGKATAKIGDKGGAVKEIQTLVGAKSDGYFGPNTKTKVEEYQKSQNVPVTGIVDSKTLGGGGDAGTGTGGGTICVTGGKSKTGDWVAINSEKDRNKLGKNVKVGTKVVVQGDSENEALVEKIWTDSKGRGAAFKFKGQNHIHIFDEGQAGKTLCFTTPVAETYKKSLNDIILEVLDEKELDEQELEGTEGGGVSTGTSDAGGKGAKTWESGVTRGSANPAGGVTHWADSYSINRGKGNPLTESKWYNTVGDVVGIVDPTGVVDGVNAMSYFKQGDIFYGMLSLISLIPYAGDLVAKPIVGAMKLGKFGGKGINAAAKSGNATKLAGSLGKTKMGKAFMGTFKNKKTQGWLASLFAKIGKIPGFGRLAKDGKTYTKLFTKAANISKTGGAVRIFRKSGGLLTKMQRRGLLGRTKLYTKFAAWMLGAGVANEALEEMPEEVMDEKFKEWAASEEGQEDIMSMPEEEKTDFIAVLKEMMRETSD